MAPALDQILLAPDVQPGVVADCLTLIQQEVSGKSGISGAAVKLAYRTARTFAKGYLQSTVENLLPDFVAALEPYWSDFTASGAAGFGDYLVKRGGHEHALSSSMGPAAAGSPPQAELAQFPPGPDQASAPDARGGR